MLLALNNATDTQAAQRNLLSAVRQLTQRRIDTVVQAIQYLLGFFEGEGGGFLGRSLTIAPFVTHLRSIQGDNAAAPPPSPRLHAQTIERRLHTQTMARGLHAQTIERRFHTQTMAHRLQMQATARIALARTPHRPRQHRWRRRPLLALLSTPKPSPCGSSRRSCDSGRGIA
jgi:hypothetical protein